MRQLQPVERGLDRTAQKTRWVEVGQWLAARREHTGLSRTQVAARLGLTTQRISSFENGDAGVPESKPEYAEELARLFDLPVLSVRASLGWWIPSVDDCNAYVGYGRGSARQDAQAWGTEDPVAAEIEGPTAGPAELSGR